jgi:hypothetical protein
MSTDFIPCVLRQLPDEELLAAARTAVEMNPANAPKPEGVAALLSLIAAHLFPELDEEERPELEPEPQHIAILTQKYWGPGGKVIPTYFLDTQDSTLKNRLLESFNSWDDNVKWVESSLGNSLARIARQRGDGYWSYLGTDYQHIGRNQPTMNLDSWSLSMPQSEWLRVPPHEAGHGRGFPHEHMRRELVDRLDEEKTVAYFWQFQRWNRQQVYAQVLTSLDERSIMATAPDQDSEMCYMLPASITKDGQPIRGGTKIDATDYAFAQKMYPRPDTPAPPPPPNPPPGGDTVIDVPKAGKYRLIT